MHSTLLTAAFASGALAQKQLGWNHAPVEKDNDAVSRNYPEVDVELLSPAFLNPETVPEGFANGTAGPTDDATLGMSTVPYLAE
jgi:hypothetical protein